MSRSRSKLARWIVLPDMQVPYEDKDTLRAVEAYMGDHRWDGYLNIGDFLDFEEISSFNVGKPGAINLSEVNASASFTAGNKILDRHVEIVRRRNRDATMVLLEGNHEFRAEAYRQRYPELGDLLDVPAGLRLRDRRIEWVKSWSEGKVFSVGHARFVHGRYINKYHAAKMVAAYGTNIYYGHTHDVQEYAHVTLGQDTTLEGGSLGCLCRHDLRYMRGGPSNWQQAFGVFYVFPDGYFNKYVVRIFKHRFISPEGKVYDGRRKK